MPLAVFDRSMAILYLLDANTIIDANRDYYPIEAVPEYWEWLVDVGRRGLVKIPIETYEECKAGRDALVDWLSNPDVKDALLFNNDAIPADVARVVNEGYAPDLTDVELLKLGQDPFLISYALDALDDICIVSTEASKPTLKRSNRRVPNVCSDLGINCCNSFTFNKALGFRTDWNR
ncbi:MAG: DUF4411 family protein [Emcibacter sp.]|nr:DUF4411 family protein [Emcibacter sp.]